MKTLFSTKGGWHPKPVFKFVDLGVADIVGRGAIRVGTLRGYGQLEGERRDNGEFAVRIDVDELQIGPDNPSPFDYFGVGLGEQKIYMRAGNLIEVGPNFPCFCTSSALSAAPKSPHAAFQIDNFPGMIDAITKLNPVLGRRFCIGDMAYLPRRGRLDELERPRPSPYIKEMSFAWEQEVRACWLEPVYKPLPRPAVSALRKEREAWSRLRDDQWMHTVDSRPSSSVARFLTRLY